MAVYQEGRNLTFIADADLSAKVGDVQTNLFRIVSIASSTANATNRKVVMATSTPDAKIVGVLNNAPAAGEPASVIGRNSQGTFKVKIGANSAAVSIGDYLTVDTDSGALKTTSAGDQIIGQALEAGVAGQVIEYLCRNFKYA